MRKRKLLMALAMLRRANEMGILPENDAIEFEALAAKFQAAIEAEEDDDDDDDFGPEIDLTGEETPEELRRKAALVRLYLVALAKKKYGFEAGENDFEFPDDPEKLKKLLFVFAVNRKKKMAMRRRLAVLAAAARRRQEQFDYYDDDDYYDDYYDDYDDDYYDDYGYDYGYPGLRKACAVKAARKIRRRRALKRAILLSRLMDDEY